MKKKLMFRKFRKFSLGSYTIKNIAIRLQLIVKQHPLFSIRNMGKQAAEVVNEHTDSSPSRFRQGLC